MDVQKVQWKKLDAHGDIPMGRIGCTLKKMGNKLILFGGLSQKGDYLNDLYEFDTYSLKWTKINALGEYPRPRESHTCIEYDSQLIFFGGSSPARLSDVYSLYKGGTI